MFLAIELSFLLVDKKFYQVQSIGSSWKLSMSLQIKPATHRWALSRQSADECSHRKGCQRYTSKSNYRIRDLRGITTLDIYWQIPKTKLHFWVLLAIDK